LADPRCTEVIVVLDDEHRETLSCLDLLAASEPRLRWLRSEHSGAGGMFARHTGAKAATGEILVFLDDDVRARPELVSRHVAHHDDDSKLVVLGYMPVKASPVRWRADYPVRLYAEAYETMCTAYERDRHEVLRNFWAGNYSLRREHALLAGTPDRRLAPLYHADRDFGFRLAQLGLEPRFDRSLLAEHAYQRPPATFLRDCRRMGAGRLMIHRLHAHQIGELPIDAYEEGLPPPSRQVVSVCRRWPLISQVIGPAVRAAAACAAVAGRREDELRLGRLFRSVEQQRGMLAARAAAVR
jgi:glycosyltransferase involved in cell wall biosynthesis